MNPLESQLDYPFADNLPAPATLIQVAPGVYWLRMGLPFALNHINLWLLEDEMAGDAGPVKGWTIVDCGIANDATRAAWESIFANQLRGLPVLRVIATHFHPDHLGLADWLCRRWQAPLWMSAGEYAFARMMHAKLPGVADAAMFPHLQRHGMQDSAMPALLDARKNYYPSLVPAVPESYIRLQDGQVLPIGGRDWRVITGFGHAPEHVALHCDSLGVLISGDMVLPRISTNVSVFPIEPQANPVQLYLDSLGKYDALAAETLVLPSHGKPFRGLHVRINQLREHHAERLAEVLEACREAPRSAADIVPIMFRRALDAHQLTFALGEALAHLHQLWLAGHLRRLQGADGVFRFTLAAPEAENL
ncbi:MBL fold metallo-hydrolase [Noviherbaspirillum sedimenti]|uniref:MBL fold metallo-hydrolase n=1 Tax=Noviherbaspirillum sedimenti TaxID=2320865 RepID=A0A3A3GTU2_9BURK|nr:MBL fold metallo-hydrolase [Noviherbaspirillum sedimenti]RJG04420.1 MBL fold metallo-hydrolase [Noviherbaspirillum sedimenti]